MLLRGTLTVHSNPCKLQESLAGTRVQKRPRLNAMRHQLCCNSMPWTHVCIFPFIPPSSLWNPEQAFVYLALVEKNVSSAVAPLGKAEAERVRRVASHALVESMNTWVALSVGRGSPGCTKTRHSHIISSMLLRSINRSIGCISQFPIWPGI